MINWIPKVSKDNKILFLLSGRGDKDLNTVAEASGFKI